MRRGCFGTFSDFFDRFVRTTQLGHGTERRPEIIDDLDTYVDFVRGKVLEYLNTYSLTLKILIFLQSSISFNSQIFYNFSVGPLRRNQVQRRKVGSRKVLKTVPDWRDDSRQGMTRTRNSDRKRSWSAPLLRKGGGGEGQWRPIVNRN